MTMASPVTAPSVPSKNSTDERREWIRIDDRVLMEYRLLTDTGTVNSVEAGSTTPEMISAAVTKPTADLLARTGESLIGSPVLPWIMKVDYLLEVILNSLATIAPSSVVMARLTNVNLSGGGVGFTSSREFAVGDRISVKMILPPFTPIHNRGRGYPIDIGPPETGLDSCHGIRRDQSKRSGAPHPPHSSYTSRTIESPPDFRHVETDRS